MKKRKKNSKVRFIPNPEDNRGEEGGYGVVNQTQPSQKHQHQQQQHYQRTEPGGGGSTGGQPPTPRNPYGPNVIPAASSLVSPASSSEEKGGGVRPVVAPAAPAPAAPTASAGEALQTPTPMKKKKVEDEVDVELLSPSHLRKQRQTLLLSDVTHVDQNPPKTDDDDFEPSKWKNCSMLPPPPPQGGKMSKVAKEKPLSRKATNALAEKKSEAALARSKVLQPSDFEGIEEHFLNAAQSPESLAYFVELVKSSPVVSFAVVFQDQHLSTNLAPQTHKYCTPKGPVCDHCKITRFRQAKSLNKPHKRPTLTNPPPLFPFLSSPLLSFQQGTARARTKSERSRGKNPLRFLCSCASLTTRAGGGGCKAFCCPLGG